MTEVTGYRPEAPQNDSRNRLVFVDPLDQHGREFHITTEPAAAPASFEEETRAVNDVYEQQILDRQRAVAEQREAMATNEQLRYSIECDTIAMANIQDFTEKYGFDPSHEELTQEKFELAA
jgi:hypothetical protein